MQKEVPCVIFRGGTSKGVFFQEDLIPPPGRERDEFLLKIMGSPDLRQIDGLGGATSTTSKVAIISRSDREDADVNYTFAQVAIDKPVVDYKGNCGNISAAVGPYAIEMGLVKVSHPETVVRIFNVNTNKVIYSHVQTPQRQVAYNGDFAISGVPGTSAPVKLSFKNPGGAVTGKILPTGNKTDVLEIPDFGPVTVSIVDVSNPLVFVRAEDIGLDGRELPEELDSFTEIMTLLETIRGVAAQKLGFVADWKEASLQSPAVPKMTIVEAAKEYRAVNGDIIGKQDMDLLGRMMSMQKTHKTYALTGALCTAAAAVIPETVVNMILKDAFAPENLRIGHPGGLIQAGVEVHTNSPGELEVLWAWGFRTARLILKGIAYYK
jgi:2-methylaconitate cis-trans-isomerase PrpF